MTLNEWEQRNIEVLTSREMGEWLCRRENRLLDKIRAEIERKANSGQWSEATIYGMQKSIAIIDKYREEQTDAT